jgi:hypothetical protein
MLTSLSVGNCHTLKGQTLKSMVYQYVSVEADAGMTTAIDDISMNNGKVSGLDPVFHAGGVAAWGYRPIQAPLAA